MIQVEKSLSIWFKYWELYQQINQIFILVPSLLGLKGNLEMTLAARLSTQVSLTKELVKLLAV